jgi:hypothetical protein
VRRQLLMNAVSLCSLWAAAWSEPVFAAHPLPEDAVKAEFVLRFADYVQWPEQAAPHGHFKIAVLGAGEIGRHLQTLAAARMVRNRPVQVRRITSIRDAADAQILYVGADRRDNLRALLAPLAGRNVLVISDEEDALESGSAINLRMADRHVRFEVSLAAARQAQLKISSELLALAVRVQK